MTQLFLAHRVDTIDFPWALIVILDEVNFNASIWDCLTPLLFAGVIHFLLYIYPGWNFKTVCLFPFKHNTQNQIQWQLYLYPEGKTIWNPRQNIYFNKINYILMNFFDFHKISLFSSTIIRKTSSNYNILYFFFCQ